MSLFYFFIQQISIKFDIHKLKKFIDLIFIFVEKIVIKLNKIVPFYLDFYQQMVENEIRLANISKTDKLLHIGCGSFPATSILLAKKTNADVTGIDNNFTSIKHALKIVNNQGFSDKIHIVHSDALDFPLDTFDLIIISQGVEPYDKILKKVSKHMKKTGRVIFRTTSTNKLNLNENHMFLNDLFRVDKIISHEKNGSLISVLLFTRCLS